jgi:5,10-methylene-tetrahydrofolate dehydrogenase/methenyl tetrahydrofolate cyclohydrolase
MKKLSHTAKTYVRMKKVAAKEAGIVSFDTTLPVDISQDEVNTFLLLVPRPLSSLFLAILLFIIY